MKVLGLASSQQSGVAYHRIVIPLAYMNGIKGQVVNWITEEYSPGPFDIVMYNRLCPYDKHWPETLDVLGNPKLVFDIDDYWRLPVNHLNYNHYQQHGEQIEENIRRADLVTVTNEVLASKVRPFNKNVVVIPNALPFGLTQFTEERNPSDKVRIFWAGGITHQHDIAILSGPVKKLSIHADKIKMILGGWTDAVATIEKYKKDEATFDEMSGALHTEQIWVKMFNSFTAGGKLPWARIHSLKPTEYMQMYEHADIMLIPLENSVWHSCKSNLKILEAASKKIPCIVSNVAPYNLDSDCPVRWVNTQKDWFYHLNELILNSKARVEEGQKLYEWAKEKYSLERINEQRFAAFADLCKV